MGHSVTSQNTGSRHLFPPVVRSLKQVDALAAPVVTHTAPKQRKRLGGDVHWSSAVALAAAAAYSKQGQQQGQQGQGRQVQEQHQGKQGQGSAKGQGQHGSSGAAKAALGSSAAVGGSTSVGGGIGVGNGTGVSGNAAAGALQAHHVAHLIAGAFNEVSEKAQAVGLASGSHDHNPDHVLGLRNSAVDCVMEGMPEASSARSSAAGGSPLVLGVGGVEGVGQAQVAYACFVDGAHLNFRCVHVQQHNAIQAGAELLMTRKWVTHGHGGARALTDGTGAAVAAGQGGAVPQLGKFGAAAPETAAAMAVAAVSATSAATSAAAAGPLSGQGCQMDLSQLEALAVVTPRSKGDPNLAAEPYASTGGRAKRHAPAGEAEAEERRAAKVGSSGQAAGPGVHGTGLAAAADQGAMADRWHEGRHEAGRRQGEEQGHGHGRQQQGQGDASLQQQGQGQGLQPGELKQDGQLPGTAAAGQQARGAASHAFEIRTVPAAYDEESFQLYKRWVLQATPLLKLRLYTVV